MIPPPRAPKPMHGNLLDDGGPVVPRSRAERQAPEEAPPSTLPAVSLAPIFKAPSARVELPNPLALSGASIRLDGAVMHGASIRRTRQGVTVAGTMGSNASVLGMKWLGGLLAIPFRGAQGEEVPMDMYVAGVRTTFSAKVRDGVEIELDLMLPEALIFGEVKPS